ncbi:hypothetical protein [Actinomadura sp. 9N215]|uniref:hypothetical protein n=1 Tax=Actinomadura sp. 9N215 TaxID=3375150 RepID=UPI00378B7BB3
MQKYRVIGPCEVAGVAPGGTVTSDALEKAGAIVEPLLGVHLEEQHDEPRAPLKKTAAKDGG